MPEPNSRKAPLPLPQAFVACHEIYSDRKTGKNILIDPISYLPITQFPAQVRCSIFFEFTGGHGSYQARMCLRDSDDDEVWEWILPERLEHHDPLTPHTVTLYGLVLKVPRPGRYILAMQLNGEEFAQRTLCFGPREEIRQWYGRQSEGETMVMEAGAVRKVVKSNVTNYKPGRFRSRNTPRSAPQWAAL